MNKIHQISAEHLSIEQIGEIIKNGTKLELSEDARQRIIRCREYLDNKIKESENDVNMLSKLEISRKTYYKSL